MKKLILLLSFTFINIGNSEERQSTEDEVIVTEVLNGASVYGKKWQTNINKIDIKDALAEHEMLIGEEMIFTGNITKVCQKRGCWMMLESNGEFARVDFNHHSFFIPKDTQGTAEVFGVLHSQTMSDEKRKHLEAEGSGKLAAKVFEITATSVKINP